MAASVEAGQGRGEYRRPAWPWLLTSIAGALVLAASFAPLGWWPFAPVGIGLLLLSWRRLPAKAAPLAGLLAGLAFFGLHVEWLRVIGPDAWVTMVVACAVLYACLALGVHLVFSGPRAIPGAPAWVACVWVGFEALRSVAPFGGFTWGNPAFTQASTPLTGWAPIAGTSAVTFVLVLTGAAVALLIEAGLAKASNGRLPGSPPAASARALAAACAAAAGLILVGALIPLPTSGEDIGGPASARLAIVQGNVPRLGLDFNAQREAVLDNHIQQTQQLATDTGPGERAPQAVIWPENSSDVDPLADPSVSARISAVVDRIGVPVLVGAVVLEQGLNGSPAHLLNMGIVWEPRTATSPGGPSDAYAKQHLVPFGEYVPFRTVLTRLIGRYSRVPLDFRPGTSSGVLQLGPARIGDVICFEIAYGGLVRQAVRDGGRAIVVQTNNATYGHTSQPAQQLAMSQFRAAEHGRAVLIAATSGISAVVAPDGEIEQQSGEFVAARLIADAPLRDSLTLSDRLGIWPALAAGLAGLGAVIVGAMDRQARRRRRRDSASDG